MTPAATAITRKRNRTLALISERNISMRLFCRAVQEKAGRLTAIPVNIPIRPPPPRYPY
jgi:hypothetical protein